MTEQEFRRALRNQVDDHIVRLKLTYAALSLNGQTLMQLARNNGVPDDTILELVNQESDRVEEALEAMVSGGGKIAADVIQ